MVKLRAADVALVRWQLTGRVLCYPCGCRWLSVGLDASVLGERRVATCRTHRRNVGLPLVPWAPA